jgi:TPR repeat protein
MLAVLKDTGAAPSATAFWVNYASGFSGVTTASATLELSRAKTPSQRAQALDLFTKAIAVGDSGAALKLAAALLQDPNLANRTKALALLGPLAASGMGDAMALLQIADPATYPTPQSAYAKYAKAIAVRGDFSALLLAIPFLSDPAAREIYRARATEVMGCSFPSAIAFARTWGSIGQTAEAKRWLTIATQLAGQDDWQMVVLGDTQREVLGAEGLTPAVALYEKSDSLGNKTAVQRLLKLYGVRGDPGYDATRAASLYATLIARSDPATIPELLAELTRRNPALAVTVSTSLDLDTLYQRAAEAGNPAGMREYARHLREVATTKPEMKAATDWLVRASEAGDAKAMVLLSQAYSLGVGIPPSLDLAHKWLQRAADAGEPTALDLVKLLQTQGASN